MIMRSVVGVAAAALVPASPAAASVTIGSQIETPSSFDNLGSYCGSVCTGVNLSLPASSKASGGLTAPMAGVVVKWRVNSQSSGNAIALRVLRPSGGDGGGGGGGGGTADTTAPVITNFKIAPKSFRIGEAAVISGDLSEPATLELRFARLVPGRIRAGKCVRQTKRVHSGRKCTKRLAVGSMTRDAAGKLSIVFRGRLSGRARPPGNYRLTAIATDAAGNASTPATTSFKLRP